ncbi:hypothetical protein NM688_g6925 [Phlebia brevispora]|uniref:Uncharacterized protein n=1 Tax=Phlebia brevispora TaxID=194682 RepID=A0ACC1SB43_9APHY|nr:hypothetical protein NM688_g6925 [Phlebia brevispora]
MAAPCRIYLQYQDRQAYGERERDLNHFGPDMGAVETLSQHIPAHQYLRVVGPQVVGWMSFSGVSDVPYLIPPQARRSLDQRIFRSSGTPDAAVSNKHTGQVIDECTWLNLMNGASTSAIASASGSLASSDPVSIGKAYECRHSAKNVRCYNENPARVQKVLSARNNRQLISYTGQTQNYLRISCLFPPRVLKCFNNPRLHALHRFQGWRAAHATRSPSHSRDLQHLSTAHDAHGRVTPNVPGLHARLVATSVDAMQGAERHDARA